MMHLKLGREGILEFHELMQFTAPARPSQTAGMGAAGTVEFGKQVLQVPSPAWAQSA